MKNAYAKLKKIERPVLVFVDSTHEGVFKGERIRLLMPDGKCEILRLNNEAACNLSSLAFEISCFYSSLKSNGLDENLINCVNEMEKFDEDWYLTITKIEVL